MSIWRSCQSFIAQPPARSIKAVAAAIPIIEKPEVRVGTEKAIAQAVGMYRRIVPIGLSYLPSFQYGSRDLGISFEIVIYLLKKKVGLRIKGILKKFLRVCKVLKSFMGTEIDRRSGLVRLEKGELGNKGFLFVRGRIDEMR